MNASIVISINEMQNLTMSFCCIASFVMFLLYLLALFIIKEKNFQRTVFLLLQTDEISLVVDVIHIIDSHANVAAEERGKTS